MTYPSHFLYRKYSEQIKQGGGCMEQLEHLGLKGQTEIVERDDTMYWPKVYFYQALNLEVFSFRPCLIDKI